MGYSTHTYTHLFIDPHVASHFSSLLKSSTVSKRSKCMSQRWWHAESNTRHFIYLKQMCKTLRQHIVSRFSAAKRIANNCCLKTKQIRLLKIFLKKLPSVYPNRVTQLCRSFPHHTLSLRLSTTPTVETYTHERTHISPDDRCQKNDHRPLNGTVNARPQFRAKGAQINKHIHTYIYTNINVQSAQFNDAALGGECVAKPQR